MGAAKATRNYDKLEQASRLLREAYDDRQLRGMSIPAYVRAHVQGHMLRRIGLLDVAEGVAEGIALASVFRLRDQKVKDQIIDVVKYVLKPLEIDIFILRERMGLKRTIHDEFTESGLNLYLAQRKILYQGELNNSITIFAENFNALLESEGIRDKDNIKAVIIYPQTVSVMSIWLDYQREAANNLINALRRKERGPEMKAAIDSIASVNPLYRVIAE
jgi:hypothetical protein